MAAKTPFLRRFTMAKSKYSGKGPYASIEEARANKPTEGKERKLYSVTCPDGRIVYTWSDGTGSALIHVARGLGYTVALHEKASPQKIAGMISQLSAEDRAALLVQFDGKAPATPPADKPAEKPAGKGKGK
jgi:hypothetical protein